MKLALTLEADSINVQALNMGRIVVLAELINNGRGKRPFTRVVDEHGRYRNTGDFCQPSSGLPEDNTGYRCH